MNINVKLKPGGLLFATVLGLGLTSVAHAAAIGTPADTNVTNQATVDYSVNSVAQTAIDSNIDDFEVDRLIDVAVVEDVGSSADVTPDQTTFTDTIRFAVTNQGNDVQDILLVATNQGDTTADPFGGPNDSWNTIGAFAYYEDDGDGNFEPGTEDLALPAGGGGAYLDEMASGETRIVWVEPADIPANDPTNLAPGPDPDPDMDDGNIAVVSLVGTVRVGGVAAALGAALTNDIASADVQGTVQNVFGDPDGPYDGPAGTGSTDPADADAAASDDSSFMVATATISLSKSSAVISDPINLLVNPKRIPGATIRYTVLVDNDAAATAAATAVTIDDVVDTTYLDESTIVLYFDEDDDGTCEASEAAPASVSYTPATDTVSMDVDAAEADMTAGSNADGDLDPGESLRFCFDIDIL